MILVYKLLSGDEERVDLGEGHFEIKDTVDDWLILNSIGITVSVLSKFGTTHIFLKKEEQEDAGAKNK